MLTAAATGFGWDAMYAFTFAERNGATLVLAGNLNATDCFSRLKGKAKNGRLVIRRFELTASGAELIEFTVGHVVRRGFALKDDEHGYAWFGYTEAGNGTPGCVWPGSPADFDNFLSEFGYTKAGNGTPGYVRTGSSAGSDKLLSDAPE